MSLAKIPKKSRGNDLNESILRGELSNRSSSLLNKLNKFFFMFLYYENIFLYIDFFVLNYKLH